MPLVRTFTPLVQAMKLPVIGLGGVGLLVTPVLQDLEESSFPFSFSPFLLLLTLKSSLLRHSLPAFCFDFLVLLSVFFLHSVGSLPF